MSEYNLNLNVKIQADDIADAYSKVAVVLKDVKTLGEITKVDLQEGKPSSSFNHGHFPGCRQVNKRGDVMRGEVCTCGPVPR